MSQTPSCPSHVRPFIPRKDFLQHGVLWPNNFVFCLIFPLTSLYESSKSVEFFKITAISKKINTLITVFDMQLISSANLDEPQGLAINKSVDFFSSFVEVFFMHVFHEILCNCPDSRNHTFFSIFTYFLYEYLQR